MSKVLSRVPAQMSVGFGARSLHYTTPLLGRVSFGAAEHQVLKEVSESRLAWLNFVPGPDTNYDVKGNKVRVLGWNGDDSEAVFQIID